MATVYDRYLSRNNDVTRTRVIKSKNTADNVTELVWKIDNLVTQGVNIPNYHKLKKQGKLLPLTPFNQYRRQGESAMSWSVDYSNGVYWQTCDWSSVPLSIPGDADLHKWKEEYPTDYFVQAAAAKIYSQGWDALTFIAELHKVKSMFRNFITRLIDNLKKGKLENIWLEGRYGWRILVLDMIEINNVLANLDDKRKRYRERVGSTVTFSESNTVTTTLGGAGTYDITLNDQWTIGRRGTVVADISPPDFGFNPITTAWELITFSFVIDWIINVGQFLESLSFIALSDEHHAAGGLEVSLTRTSTVGNFKPNALWTGSISGNASHNVTWTNRSVAKVSVNPLLQWRIDGLKVFDLIALLLQLLKGR